MKIIFLFLALLLLLNISVAFGDDSVCSHFYNRLSELPHTKLTLNIDSFISLWNEKRLEGCEVVYESHESMIPGSRVYDLFESFIHTPGWIVNNNLAADGPGSSTIGIENDTSRCSINWSQHAWVDEKTKEHRQSSQIKMIVQCSLK